MLTVAAPSGKLSAKELPASASSVAALKSCDCRSAPVLSSYITVRTMCVSHPLLCNAVEMASASPEAAHLSLSLGIHKASRSHAVHARLLS